MVRQYACADCLQECTCSSKGKIRQRCQDCSSKRALKRQSDKARMAAGLPPRPSHIACIDCQETTAVKAKGPVPKRCNACAWKHHVSRCNARSKANPDRVKKYKRRCYERHAESYRAYGREQGKRYYWKNREAVLEKLRNLSPEKRAIRAEKLRLQRQQNPEEVRARDRDLYHTNMNHRIASVLRARMTSAVKARSAGGSLVRDLGVSISEFMDYIERKFSPGMTWSNYGESWELDHIYPLSKADLTDRSQFLAVANYRNYQPLTPAENMAKSDRITPRAAALFLMLVSDANRRLREQTQKKRQKATA